MTLTVKIASTLNIVKTKRSTHVSCL